MARGRRSDTARLGRGWGWMVPCMLLQANSMPSPSIGPRVRRQDNLNTARKTGGGVNAGGALSRANSCKRIDEPGRERDQKDKRRTHHHVHSASASAQYAWVSK